MLESVGYSYSSRRLNFQRAFLQAFIKTGKTLTAAKAVGISTQTIYAWMDEFPEFSQLVSKAHQLHLDIKLKTLTDIEATKQLESLLSELCPK